MKKEFKGIDGFIQSTESKKKEKEEIEYVGMFLRVPIELQKQINMHCAENGLKKKEFIMNVISDFFNK